MENRRPKFKVGDEVILIDNKWGSVNEIGDIGVVIEVNKGRFGEVGYRVQVEGVEGNGNWSGESELTLNSEEDIVNHPNHYTQGIECWDYITSHNMNYLQGNIIKYVTRYKHKNGLEDLKKAQAYINKLIETEYENTNE